MMTVSEASTKSSVMGLPKKTTTTRENREYTLPIIIPARSPAKMRSPRRAPMFCPP